MPGVRLLISLPRNDNVYTVDYDPIEHHAEIEDMDVTGMFVSDGTFPDCKMVTLYSAILNQCEKQFELNRDEYVNEIRDGYWSHYQQSA